MNVLRLVAIFSVLVLGQAVASATDLHQFWDNRCHECHGHAGSFARAHLRIDNGQLVGRHHRDDLRRFLGQHEMGPANADGIYAMLLAQAATPPVFQQKCSGCHQTAAEFARTSLMEKDGAVVGRSSQKELSQYLQRHGGLRQEEISIVVDTLTRVLRETLSSPAK